MNNNKIFKILSPIVLMVFFITGFITLAVFFKPLYYMDIALLDIPERSGMSEADIKANYDALIDYYAPFSNEELALPTLPMSEEGKIHFEDVKALFNIVIYTFFVSVPLAVAVVYINHERREYYYLKHSAVATLVVPLVLGALIALNWDNVFRTFHEIFFSNDYWIFDPRYDPVILMLPDTFFMHAALFVLLGVLLSSLLCHIVGDRLVYKIRSRI